MSRLGMYAGVALGLVACGETGLFLDVTSDVPNVDSLLVTVSQGGTALVTTAVPTEGVLKFPARVEIKPNGRTGVANVEVKGLVGRVPAALAQVELNLASQKAVAVNLRALDRDGGVDAGVDAGCGANLIGNGDFAVDLGGWSAVGGALVRRVPMGVGGSAGALEVCHGTGPLESSVETSMPFWTQPPDAGTLHISAWVRSSDGGSTEADAQILEDADGGYQGDSSGPSQPIVTGAWTKVEGVYRSKFSPNELRVELFSFFGNCVQFDNICVEKVAP